MDREMLIHWFQKYNYKEYGVAVLNIIKPKIAKLNIKVKEIITKAFNCIWYEVVDAASFATFCLIIFKLVYRIINWNFSSIWYINLLILILAFILAIKYKCYDYIREGYVHYICKPLLGKRAYYLTQSFENIEDEGFAPLKALFYELRERTNDEYILNARNNYEIKNKVINYFCQNIFIFFVFFRLFILKYFYLYILLYFICISFLIFNQYLIITSFISLILFFSKLSFHLTDYTIKNFYFSAFYGLEAFDSNTHNIQPTWLNAIIITQWIFRSFSNRESFYLIKKQHYIEIKNNTYPTNFDKQEAKSANLDYLSFKLKENKNYQVKKKLNKICFYYPDKDWFVNDVQYFPEDSTTIVDIFLRTGYKVKEPLLITMPKRFFSY